MQGKQGVTYQWGLALQKCFVYMPTARSVLFCSVLFCSVLFCSVLFCSVSICCFAVLLSFWSFFLISCPCLFQQVADLTPDSQMLKCRPTGVCGAVPISQQLHQYSSVRHDAGSRALPLTDSGVEREAGIAICILQGVGGKVLACGPHLQA